MYSHTKKVGSLGRYGVRVGRKLRNEIRKIEDESRKSRLCPSCGKKNIRRTFSGVWRCKSCKLEFVGGAYSAAHRRVNLEEKE